MRQFLSLVVLFLVAAAIHAQFFPPPPPGPGGRFPGGFPPPPPPPGPGGRFPGPPPPFPPGGQFPGNNGGNGNGGFGNNGGNGNGGSQFPGNNGGGQFPGNNGGGQFPGNNGGGQFPGNNGGGQFPGNNGGGQFPGNNGGGQFPGNNGGNGNNGGQFPGNNGGNGNNGNGNGGNGGGTGTGNNFRPIPNGQCPNQVGRDGRPNVREVQTNNRGGCIGDFYSGMIDGADNRQFCERALIHDTQSRKDECTRCFDDAVLTDQRFPKRMFQNDKFLLCAKLFTEDKYAQCLPPLAADEDHHMEHVSVGILKYRACVEYTRWNLLYDECIAEIPVDQEKNLQLCLATADSCRNSYTRDYFRNQSNNGNNNNGNNNNNNNG